MGLRHSVETKAVVILNTDNNEMFANNPATLKTESPSFSDASFVGQPRDDDDNCSSSTVLLSCSVVETECSVSIASSSDFGKSLLKSEETYSTRSSYNVSSFTSLRLKYLLVTLVIMLADGLQGTHLYVLYEGYGFNVASLYALGFITGAVTTPITGPLIDKFGRKRSAMIYCALEMGINMLEQYPFLAGLLLSRMVGGITTNLLSSVFETWLDTEFRNRRRLSKSAVDTASIIDDDSTTTTEASSGWTKYDDYDDAIARNEYGLIMRDSVIVSNLASIASGYLAHILAKKYGPVGPFQGAVSCTGIALVVISLLWTENYGTSSTSPLDEEEEASDSDTATGQCDDEGNACESHGLSQPPSSKGLTDYMTESASIFRSDPKILYLGIIQGLSAGSLQIFIFLWSPTLQLLSPCNNASTRTSTCDNGATFSPKSYFSWAVDGAGDPAYGLIFGAFMAAGVTGGLCAPFVRQAVGLLFPNQPKTVHFQGEETSVRSKELELLVGMNYIFAAFLMLLPSVLSTSSADSFSIALSAFLIYEFLAGITMPCEGVIRSLYLPSDGRATMMMVPRMVVNLAVSLGVLLTRYIPKQKTFVAVAFLMASAGFLQLSFLSSQEWTMIRRKSMQRVRGLSTLATNIVQILKRDRKDTTFGQEDISSRTFDYGPLRKEKSKYN